MTTIPVLWTLEDWAQAVRDLPVQSECPDRTVLVPNGRVAHAHRRELSPRNAADALIGTRLATLTQLAYAWTSETEGAPQPRDLELCPQLVHSAFAQVPLQRLHRGDLLDLSGWDEAFSRTVSELEAAQVAPDALLDHSDAHVRDVGRIIASLKQDGEFASVAAVLARAVELAPSVAMRGTTLAVVSGFESPAEVALLRVLPNVHWALWMVRPVSSAHLQRVELLLGGAFANALREARPPASAQESAVQHVQQSLFESKSEVVAPADDSVRIATYAGVHDEIEAAVGWAVEQVMDHGIPAQEIAILAPSAEPYGSLLRARFGALPWPKDCEPVFCEQGIPLLERADGQRFLRAIRALRAGLSRESLAPLLPLLRVPDRAVRVRGLSHAWQLLNTVAIVGGSPSHLAGGQHWPTAWRRALERLALPPRSGGGLAEREQADRTALQVVLSATNAAIDALTDVLNAVIASAPLNEVWLRLNRFAQAHLRLPPAEPRADVVLEASCGLFDAHPTHEPRGDDALAWLERTLAETTYSTGRFGQPSIYLGTLAGVRGLAFRAVRIIGLTEGAVPSAVREDPVLPDAARRSLSLFLPTSRSRAHRQLVEFESAVRTAREQLVLSAPKVSLEGSSRQPAAVLLDVVRALFGSSDDRGLAKQLEDAAHEGRTLERRNRQRLGVSASARLARAAAGDHSLLDHESNPAIALSKLRAIRERTTASAQDGILSDLIPRERLAGLSAERPISATRLATLLGCPHQFLYEHVLGFREPEQPLQAYAVHALRFGKWVHEIAEEYWREHGPELGSRRGGLEAHQVALQELALRKFEMFRESYPLANDDVAGAMRQSLCDQLAKLLTLDWNGGAPRTFVDVERSFGHDEPCIIDSEAGSLYVRGQIDKLDLDGSTLLLRDIKTATGKPRKSNDPPDLSIDLQLGVYAQVARVMASRWGTPDTLGVAYLYLRRGESERRWIVPDYAVLDAHVRSWMAAAVDALEHAAFVRTAEPKDCRFCPHQAVCAPEMERAELVLTDARVPRRIAELKGVRSQ